MSDAFAHLSPEDRGRAEALAERFRELGAEEPEDWALSEVEEDIPQLARFIFLRRLWRSAQQWTEPPAEWFAGLVSPAGLDGEEGEEEPLPELDDADDPPFLAAREAVHRMLAAGASADDLKEVARAIFLHTLFDAVHTVDDGYDPLAGEGMPGWLLAEVSGDLMTTNRVLDGLHEDLFTTEPDEGSA